MRSYEFIGSVTGSGSFTRNLAQVGDVDGDGLGDVLISDETASGGGNAWLISAADLASLDALDGATDGQIDVDLIPGAGTSGSYQFSSTDSQTLLSVRVGVDISSAGDVDNNGVNELFIAVGGAGGFGEVFVIDAADLSALDALDGVVDGDIDMSLISGTGGTYQFTSSSGNRLDYEISSAGDIDNDGLDDLIIARSQQSIGGGSNNGGGYIISAADFADLDALDGSTDGEINLDLVAGTGGSYQFIGAGANDTVGSSVSSAGDVDGDGFDDLLIGANQAGSSGETYLISGADLAALDALDGSTDGEIDLGLVAGTGESYRFIGDGVGTGAGFEVSSAGDVDGDGLDDLLIGSPIGSTAEGHVILAKDLAAADDDGTGEDGIINLADIGYNQIVEGTGSDDLIDQDYTADPTLDRVTDDDDVIQAGAGDDTIVVSGGSDTIDGGAGQDTLQDASVVAVDNDGDGTAITSGDTDTFTSVESFVGGTGATTDAITITDTGTGYRASDISGLDDNAIGTFTPGNGDPVINFGPTSSNQLSTILASGVPGTIQITSGDENGQVGNISFENFETINFGIACFCAGTRICTKDGETPIEDLSVGDKVFTMDHGDQSIRWIGSTTLDAIDLAKNPKLRPIRIRAGALGQGLPVTDLMVSPQHRILVRSAIAERMFGTHEVLIPAIKLIGLMGIDRIEDMSEVTYWHMLFDTHEVIFSNGAPTESLFTGPEALKSVSPESRREIMSIFPELSDMSYIPKPARTIPERGKLVRKLVSRHQKNEKPMLMKVG